MPRKPSHILVVDDDTVTCEMLCEVFAHEGFETTFVHSGEEALASLATLQADLLLSDIRMKTRLDGLSLLELVHRDYSAIPVVLMTAFGSIETAIRGSRRRGSNFGAGRTHTGDAGSIQDGRACFGFARRGSGDRR